MRAKFQTQQRKSEADKLYLNSIHFHEIGKAGLPRFCAGGRIAQSVAMLAPIG